MARAPVSEDAIVRANLKRFREEAGFTQAEASEASGVPYNNLTRYESGKIESVPVSVVSALGKIYGHTLDDFVRPDPPATKRDDLPVFFLRTRPGAEVDAEVLMKLQRIVDEVNRDVRGRRKK